MTANVEAARTDGAPGRPVSDYAEQLVTDFEHVCSQLGDLADDHAVAIAVLHSLASLGASRSAASMIADAMGDTGEDVDYPPGTRFPLNPEDGQPGPVPA